MGFVALPGYKAPLIVGVSKESRELPLSISDKRNLTERLGHYGYSYLLLDDGSETEVIKVTNDSGDLIIDRGQDGTEAIQAGYCSRVSFVWTESALRSMVESSLQNIQGLVTQIKSANDCLNVSNEEGVVTIEKPAQKEISWNAGNRKLTQNKCGVITEEDRASGLADGEYKNATIQIKNGEIVAISAGDNIVYTGGGCCCNCDKEEKDE